MFCFMNSRRNLPIKCVDSASLRAGHVDGIIPEIGHLQVAEEQSAIGVRIVAHASMAFGANSAISVLNRPFKSNNSSGL